LLVLNALAAARARIAHRRDGRLSSPTRWPVKIEPCVKSVHVDHFSSAAA